MRTSTHGEGLLEPDTTSRSGISEHLFGDRGGVMNRSIRRALGFREVGGSAKGTPVFNSAQVRELYQKINDLATRKLPIEDMHELENSWESGKYQPDIDIILADHGRAIWGDSLEQRHMNVNPKSQLLVAGHQEGYPVDLFWHRVDHRAFIALQLEHLTFLKAKAYHKNHISNPNSVTNRNLSVADDSDTPEASASSIRPSLLVVLRLPKHKFSKICKKYSPYSLVSSKRKASEDPSYQPHGSARMLGGNADKANRRSSRTHNRASDVGESHFDINDYPELMGLDENARQDVEEPRDDEVKTVEETGSTGVETLSDEKLRMMRDELHMCFLAETASSKQLVLHRTENVSEMWDESERLDNNFSRLWVDDEARILHDLGDRYDEINDALDVWLLIRNTARKLGRLVGVHHLQGIPFPRLTYEEWVEKLQGEEQYDELKAELIRKRQTIRRSGVCEATEENAQRIADALGAVTMDPNAARARMKGILNLNQTLYSWSLDI